MTGRRIRLGAGGGGGAAAGPRVPGDPRSGSAGVRRKDHLCLAVEPGQEVAFVSIVLTNHTEQDFVLTDVRPLEVEGATVDEVFVTTIPVLADGTHEVPGVNGPWPWPEPHEWLDRTPVAGERIAPGGERGVVFRLRPDAEGGGFPRVAIDYTVGDTPHRATWAQALELRSNCSG